MAEETPNEAQSPAPSDTSSNRKLDSFIRDIDLHKGAIPLDKWNKALDRSLHRFSEFIPLTDTERAEVWGGIDRPIEMPRGATICPQGEKPTCLYLLIEGWASVSIDLDNGTRQIAKIHLPGDLMGAPSMSLAETAASLNALTSVVVARLPLNRFARLFINSPRFAMAMFLSAQRERVALMDGITRIGRRSSLERMAEFLLDLRERLSAAGVVRENRFDLPLRQYEIADLLGITVVHVNRIFNKLVRDGLIRRHWKQVEIVDENALISLARWRTRYNAAAMPWMVDFHWC